MTTSVPVAVTRMTFDDEFNTFSNSPGGRTGTWMTTFPYNGEGARTLPATGEQEYYSDSSVGENPFSLANGVLSITAEPAAAGSNPYNLPYDSGLLTTNTSFSQEYGYFEVNAELPSGAGLWPAFWMVPQSYTAELDIFEAIGQDSTTIYNSVHGTTNGLWGSSTQASTVPKISAGFNTYGVDWEPTTTTFYVNGVAVASAPTPSSMDVPMYMLLNLAVGGPGSWPGPPNASTVFPATMKIDYVRAYATANTNYVGGRAAIVATASANDTVITAAGGGSITDSSGNAWTIVNGQVAMNGATDYGTYGVTELAYVNGAIWQKNYANLWLEKADPSASWSPVYGTTQPPIAITVKSATANVTSTIDATKKQTVMSNGSVFNLTAPGNATVVVGSIKSTITFVAMTNIVVTAGSAVTTLTVNQGIASFIGGKAIMDITGGPGHDTYIFNPGNAGFIIEDFATAVDTLNIASSLKSALTVTSDGRGGSLLSFGTAAGTIDLKGISNFSGSAVLWS